jgi:AcrR family transcriptional regulator
MDAIFGAAAQILEREGQQAFNTNHIAAIAGVSIGTLYQYFEDKDAILLGMAQREYARIRGVIADQLAGSSSASLRAIVHAVLYAFDGRQAVRAAVFNARREGTHAGPIVTYNRAFMDEIGRRIGARIKIPEEAAFIVSRLVVSISRQLLFEGKTLRLDNLEDELVCVLESYLAALRARGVRPTANR